MSRNISYILVLIFIAYFSIYLPFGYSPDYLQYDFYTEFSRNVDIVELLAYRFEPGFALLVNVLSLFILSNEMVFMVIVLFSTALKLYVINKESTIFGVNLAILLFFFKIFPLQDFNQIRAALAMSILFVFYIELFDKSRLYRLMVLGALAGMFHYSSLLVIPFFFIIRYFCSLRAIVFMGIIVFALLKVSSGFLVDFLGQNLTVVESYDNRGREDVGQALFSPVFFPEYFMIATAILLWQNCPAVMRRLVAFQILGFAFFYGISDFNVFAVRGREMFSAFWLLFVCNYGAARRELRIAILIFVASSILLGIYLFFYLEYFSFQRSIDI